MIRKAVLFLFFLLASCETTTAYNNKLNKWVGKSESDLIAAWGEPDSVFKLGQSQQIITYVKNSEVIIPAEETLYNPDFNSTDTLYAPFSYQEDFALPISTSDGYVVDNICQTSFHIKDGIVQSWQWKGNDCVAY
jgi:hypothetical protein